MKEIHDVFTADTDDEEDPTSLKKLKKQEAQRNLENEVLDFHFNGTKEKIWLASEKRDKLLLTLSKCIRGTKKGERQDDIVAINFKEFHSVTSKLHHALIYIPQEN